MKATMRILLIALFFYPTILFSQCAIEDILVFDPGISKFDVIKKSKSVKGFVESKSNAGVIGKWVKPEYLKDSVFMDQHVFDVTNLHCYKLNRCIYSVYFSDDKLFKQNIQLEFDATNYNDFTEIYNKMSQLFKLDFPFSKPITINQPGNVIKAGEGYVFTETEGVQEKTDQVKIYNTIVYKRDVASGTLTSEIERYLIVIESVDLQGTKLDQRGY